jgi:hypothetical protein
MARRLHESVREALADGSARSGEEKCERIHTAGAYNTRIVVPSRRPTPITLSAMDTTEPVKRPPGSRGVHGKGRRTTRRRGR